MKLVCQRRAPWKTGIFQRGRVELHVVVNFLLNIWYQQKKKKKERSVLLPTLGFILINSFISFFMIHEATRYILYQSYRQNKDDTMEVKSKLYLQITLLINYMMEENLFLYVVWSSVKHAASVFPVEKNFTKKEKNKSDIWMDRYFRSRSCQFFI